MKKLMHCLLMALCLSVFAPLTLKAEAPSVTMVHNENANEKASLARLKAIREMTRSHLSKSEKKELRKEVLSIKERHKGPGGVIYISTGALILIIILLIILL